MCGHVSVCMLCVHVCMCGHVSVQVVCTCVHMWACECVHVVCTCVHVWACECVHVWACECVHVSVHVSTMFYTHVISAGVKRSWILHVLCPRYPFGHQERWLGFDHGMYFYQRTHVLFIILFCCPHLHSCVCVHMHIICIHTRYMHTHT